MRILADYYFGGSFIFNLCIFMILCKKDFLDDFIKNNVIIYVSLVRKSSRKHDGVKKKILLILVNLHKSTAKTFHKKLFNHIN